VTAFVASLNKQRRRLFQEAADALCVCLTHKVNGDTNATMLRLLFFLAISINHICAEPPNAAQIEEISAKLKTHKLQAPLLQEVWLEARSGARLLGNVKVPAGTKVVLDAIDSRGVLIRFNNSTAQLPFSSIDLTAIAQDAAPIRPAGEQRNKETPEKAKFVDAIGRAMLGDAGGARDVATSFMEGKGTKQDYAQAYVWFTVVELLTKLEEKSKVDAMDAKLSSIIIPRLQFYETPLRRAFEFIQQQSVELDKTEPTVAKKGITLVLKIESRLESEPVTFDLANLPLGIALDYLANLGNCKVVKEKGYLTVVPFNYQSPVMGTMEYDIPDELAAQFWPIESRKKGSRNREPDPTYRSAKDFLESQGIMFPSGAGANYLPDKKKLIVRNGEESLKLVTEFISASGGVATEIRAENPLKSAAEKRLPAEKLSELSDQANELLQQIVAAKKNAKESSASESARMEGDWLLGSNTISFRDDNTFEEYAPDKMLVGRGHWEASSLTEISLFHSNECKSEITLLGDGSLGSAKCTTPDNVTYEVTFRKSDSR
jgi:hypothetical protein